MPSRRTTVRHPSAVHASARNQIGADAPSAAAEQQADRTAEQLCRDLAGLTAEECAARLTVHPAHAAGRAPLTRAVLRILNRPNLTPGQRKTAEAVLTALDSP